MNTDEQIMAWIMDTYSMHARHAEPAVVTGKPIELGGSQGRREATGRGLLVVCHEACKVLGLDRRQATVAIQGAGNVGGVAAQLMRQAGYRVVAISDIHGGIYHPGGLDIAAALQYVKENRTFEEFKGADPISNEDLLKLPCDILLPAATHNQITTKNVDHLRCRIVCEGANGPTTAPADRVLEQRGILVIPDILANAGGVTVSYFERVQNRMGYFWTERMVNHRLSSVMARSFGEVRQYAEQYQVDMRTAAYMVAIDRVATDVRMRGIYA